MKYFIPFLSLALLLFLTNCGNAESEAQKAETAKAAAEEQAAAKLDSLTNVLEKQKAEIQEGVQKLDETLKAIEE